MIDHIQIERNSEDGLTQWHWRFYFSDRTLWLDFYAEYSRPSRRHGFQRVEFYNRLGRESTIKEADVFLPADLQKEAIAQFCESITVKRWSQRQP